MKNKAKKIEPEPFKPCVSLSEAIRFDPDKPETHTCSPLMNAVLKAFAVVGLSSTKAVCDYLRVSPRKLWPAVELLTGFDQFTFRWNIVINRLNALKREHPDWSADMYAKALGYSSRAALYNLLGREDYDEAASNKEKPQRYYYNRQHPEEKES